MKLNLIEETMRRDRMNNDMERNKFRDIVDEYLTRKNVLWGLGIASLTGIATYSAVRAFKNEQLVGRIKSELNFGKVKREVASKVSQLRGKRKQAEDRKALKGNRAMKGKKPKSAKRFVTG